MAWNPVRVRVATADDLEVLLELAGELREQLLPSEAGRGRGTRVALESRYREALEDPEREVVLAVCARPGEEQVLGMALITVGNTNALLDLPAVHMTHAVVTSAQRRRGAGKALVAYTADYAEQRGIDQLVVSVPPGSRDAARFFARLGFAPLSVRRTAPVAVVRRRLAGVERGTEPIVRRSRRPGGMTARVGRTDARGF
jgi:ribosomal protein S18 acetylase RimI-like enzyme